MANLMSSSFGVVGVKSEPFGAVLYPFCTRTVDQAMRRE
jgi:hypothetical protein